jgi:hypothetical protein
MTTPEYPPYHYTTYDEDLELSLPMNFHPVRALKGAVRNIRAVLHEIPLALGANPDLQPIEQPTVPPAE